jgi:aminoglycoside 2'-N-acetyltransferase I
MAGILRIEVVAGADMDPALRAQTHSLCSRAYEEDMTELLGQLVDPTHVLGFVATGLASHALWVTRWLEVGATLRLRTAYVEAVATDPCHQGQGFASAIMTRLASAIAGYDLGALSPADTGLYARLGWTYWRGPLFIRAEGGLIPTPGERVMVLPLPGTPTLDLHASLSAEWRAGELW